MTINDVKIYVNFQMFGTRELDVQVRRDFALPANPYNVEIGMQGQDYLMSLGIFYYRDEDNGLAIIMGGDDIVLKESFSAFKFQGLLHRQSMTMGEWDVAKTFSQKKELDTKQKKQGDLKAWLHFNTSGTISKIEEGSVHFV